MGIASRLMVGTAVAIPAASLCINRRLYHIACVQTVTVTKAEVCLSRTLLVALLTLASETACDYGRFSHWNWSPSVGDGASYVSQLLLVCANADSF